MRLALLGVSHWHCPLYLPGFDQDGIDVVGVSDSDPAARERIADLCSTRAYASDMELLDQERPDFVFAFAPHALMPQLARTLIERRLPFVMEKPFGTSQADVTDLLQSAGDLFIAVPFIYRISGLRHVMEEAFGGFGGRTAHLAIRNIAGPPERYLKMGVPWMLDPAISGGGCLINLAVHFIDFALLVTGEPIGSVSCRISTRTHGSDVEDYAILMLHHTGGAISSVEVGYTFPQSMAEKREFTLTCSTDRAYVRTIDGGLRVLTRPDGDSRDIATELDTDFFYATFVRQTLQDFAARKRPMAGLAEMNAVMAVVDAAYASAANNGAVQPIAVQ